MERHKLVITEQIPLPCTTNSWNQRRQLALNYSIFHKKSLHTYLQNETIYILTYRITKHTRKNLVFIYPLRAHHTLVLAPAATPLQYACFTSL